MSERKIVKMYVSRASSISDDREFVDVSRLSVPHVKIPTVICDKPSIESMTIVKQTTPTLKLQCPNMDKITITDSRLISSDNPVSSASDQSTPRFSAVTKKWVGNGLDARNGLEIDKVTILSTPVASKSVDDTETNSKVARKYARKYADTTKNIIRDGSYNVIEASEMLEMDKVTFLSTALASKSVDEAESNSKTASVRNSSTRSYPDTSKNFIRDGSSSIIEASEVLEMDKVTLSSTALASKSVDEAETNTKTILDKYPSTKSYAYTRKIDLDSSPRLIQADEDLSEAFVLRGQCNNKIESSHIVLSQSLEDNAYSSSNSGSSSVSNLERQKGNVSTIKETNSQHTESQQQPQQQQQQQQQASNSYVETIYTANKDDKSDASTVAIGTIRDSSERCFGEMSMPKLDSTIEDVHSAIYIAPFLDPDSLLNHSFMSDSQVSDSLISHLQLQENKVIMEPLQEPCIFPKLMDYGASVVQEGSEGEGEVASLSASVGLNEVEAEVVVEVDGEVLSDIGFEGDEESVSVSEHGSDPDNCIQLESSNEHADVHILLTDNEYDAELTSYEVSHDRGLTLPFPLCAPTRSATSPVAVGIDRVNAVLSDLYSIGSGVIAGNDPEGHWSDYFIGRQESWWSINELECSMKAASNGSSDRSVNGTNDIEVEVEVENRKQILDNTRKELIFLEEPDLRQIFMNSQNGNALVLQGDIDQQCYLEPVLASTDERNDSLDFSELNSEFSEEVYFVPESDRQTGSFAIVDDDPGIIVDPLFLPLNSVYKVNVEVISDANEHNGSCVICDDNTGTAVEFERRISEQEGCIGSTSEGEYFKKGHGMESHSTHMQLLQQTDKGERQSIHEGTFDTLECEKVSIKEEKSSELVGEHVNVENDHLFIADSLTGCHSCASTEMTTPDFSDASLEHPSSLKSGASIVDASSSPVSVVATVTEEEMKASDPMCDLAGTALNAKGNTVTGEGKGPLLSEKLAILSMMMREGGFSQESYLSVIRDESDNSTVHDTA